MDKQSEGIVPSGTSMGNQSVECGGWERPLPGIRVAGSTAYSARAFLVSAKEKCQSRVGRVYCMGDWGPSNRASTGHL